MNIQERIRSLRAYTSCLIVVDMINAFVYEGMLHDEAIARIIPRQIELIKEAKEKGKLIIFIKDAHTLESTEFIRYGNQPHSLKNTSEAELVAALKEYENEEDTISIEKNSTSFMEAPDFRLLIESQPTITEFEIIGCCTDICVLNGSMALANYLDQWNRQHKIMVYEDAIATFAEENRKDFVDATKLLMKQQGIEWIEKEIEGD